MNLPTEKEVRETAILIVRSILEIGSGICEGTLAEFSEERLSDFKDPNNKTTVIDQDAHNRAKAALKLAFKRKIIIYGEEERRKPRGFQNVHKIVAFIDAIDGTDLLLRDFSNWCCAMLFAIPSERRILCSVVGHSSGDIYYANNEGAFVRPRIADGRKHMDRKLRRNADIPVDLCHASICYYGQKPKNFLEVAQHQKFCARMDEFSQRMVKKVQTLGRPAIDGEKLAVRVYNLGGNPMMVRIPSGAVDAIFSLGGAEIHDVLPGAYVAVQAGATFTDLEGTAIDCGSAIQTPLQKIRYILSGSKQLATDIRDVLRIEKKNTLHLVQVEPYPQSGIADIPPPCDT